MITKVMALEGKVQIKSALGLSLEETLKVEHFLNDQVNTLLYEKFACGIRVHLQAPVEAFQKEV